MEPIKQPSKNVEIPFEEYLEKVAIIVWKKINRVPNEIYVKPYYKYGHDIYDAAENLIKNQISW